MAISPLHPNKRDASQVEVLVGMGASEEFIASHLSLSTQELHEHYEKQLSSGREEANLQVAKTFFDLATSGDHPQITLAWMRMRAGWRDAPPPTTQSDQGDLDDDLRIARDKLEKLLNRGS